MKPVIDRWTAVHIAVGIAAGLAHVRPAVAVPGAIAYEVIEHQFEEREETGAELLSNAVIDVWVFALGYYAARYIAQR